MSAIVSVYAQKYGGQCVHPMGRASGMAIKGDGFSALSDGMSTAKDRAAVGESGTW
jgi:hypothetical protein